MALAQPSLPQKNILLHAFGPILMSSWPHPPANLKTSDWNGMYAYGDYTGYLKDPPPPVFDTTSPVKLENACAYFQESFWDGFVAKYGAQSIKIPTAGDFTISTLEFRASSNFHADISKAFASQEAARHVLTGIDYLRETGAPILADYLQALTVTSTEARRFKQHLNYTKKTWRKTDGSIEGLRDKVQAQFETLSGAFPQLTADNAQFFSQSYNNIASDILELGRLLGKEVFHSQHLVFGYLKRSAADQAILGMSFMNDLLNRWTIHLTPHVDYILNTVLAWSAPNDAIRMDPATSGIPADVMTRLYGSRNIETA